MYGSYSVDKLLNDIGAINPRQQDGWIIKPDELAKIGKLSVKHMTVEDRLDELKELIPLYQKYPPVYGNTVGVPFLKRIGELVGRGVSPAEALDGSKIMLEVAQLMPSIRTIVNEARANELQDLLSRKAPGDLTPMDLSDVSRLIGRQVTIRDVAGATQQAELIEKVRRGELKGADPSEQSMRKAAQK